MPRHSSSPLPSDQHDEFDREHINVDAIPDLALGSLVEIELPKLTPRFGLMPDLATFVDGDPPTPDCPPPPGMDEVPAADRLHWHRSWDRIHEMLKDPVQAFTWRGNKRVLNVLRSWVLVVWPDGRITPLQWQTSSCGVVRLAPVPFKGLNLARLASEGGWLSVICEGILWELAHARLHFGQLTQPHAHGASDLQTFENWREPLLAKVRGMRLDSWIQARLELDAQAVTFAQGAYGLKHHGRANEVTVDSYNWVLEHWMELDTLQREAPNLLGFFPLAAREAGIGTSYEVTHQLKRMLTRAVGRKAWLLMLRHGRHLFVEVRERYGVSDMTAWLDLLQLHSLLGGDAPAPAPLLDLVMRQFGNRFSQRRKYFTPVQRALQAWEHFGELWRKSPPANERELDDWALVAGWIADPMGPCRFDARQRALGFEHLVKKARAWERSRSALVATHNEPLPVWHAPVRDQLWELRFLKDRMAFWNEGTAMGHCLGRRGGPTVGADKLFASVYFQGRHIGTALYTGHARQWALAEAHGKFNRPLAAQELHALRKLAHHLCKPSYLRGGTQ